MSKGLSRRQYAKSRGVSETSVRKRLADGTLKPALLPNDKLDPALADALMAAGTIGGKNVTPDLAEARRLKLAAQCALLADDITAQAALVVEADKVEAVVGDRVSGIAARILKIADAAKGLAGLSAAEASSKLTEAINLAMSDLSKPERRREAKAEPVEPFSFGSMTAVELAAWQAAGQAKLLQMRRDVRNRTVVPIADVAHKFAMRTAATRSRLFALPGSIAPKLTLSRNGTEARKVVLAELQEIVGELRA